VIWDAFLVLTEMKIVLLSAVLVHESLLLLHKIKPVVFTYAST